MDDFWISIHYYIQQDLALHNIWPCCSSDCVGRNLYWLVWTGALTPFPSQNMTPKHTGDGIVDFFLRPGSIFLKLTWSLYRKHYLDWGSPQNSVCTSLWDSPPKHPPRSSKNLEFHHQDHYPFKSPNNPSRGFPNAYNCVRPSKLAKRTMLNLSKCTSP